MPTSAAFGALSEGLALAVRNSVAKGKELRGSEDGAYQPLGKIFLEIFDFLTGASLFDFLCALTPEPSFFLFKKRLYFSTPNHPKRPQISQVRRFHPRTSQPLRSSGPSPPGPRGVRGALGAHGGGLGLGGGLLCL